MNDEIYTIDGLPGFSYETNMLYSKFHIVFIKSQQSKSTSAPVIKLELYRVRGFSPDSL